MSDPNDIIEPDAGQTNVTNMKSMLNHLEKEHELSESVQKQESNSKNENEEDVQQNQEMHYDTYDGMQLNNEQANLNDSQLESNGTLLHCKGVNIEMECERDNEYDKEDYVEDVVNKALHSLHKWIKHKAIEGVNSLNKDLVEDLKDIDKQMIDPKVVCRKTGVIVETILQLKTTTSACQLCQLEQEYCDRFASHILQRILRVLMLKGLVYHKDTC